MVAITMSDRVWTAVSTSVRRHAHAASAQMKSSNHGPARPTQSRFRRSGNSQASLTFV